MKYFTKKMKYELLRNKAIYKIGNHFVRKEKTITKKLIKKKVMMVPSIADEIADRLANGKPTLLARLGNTEGHLAGEYCEKKLGIRKDYTKSWFEYLYLTSGFFADDYEDKSEAIDKYCEMTLEGIPHCDYLSATFPTGYYMPFFFHNFARDTTPIFSDFGPCFDTPTEKTWLKGLKGKKVLVINSFADSIKSQYERKASLVRSPEYELPDFELITYKTFVTQCDERPEGMKNFFEVYNRMLSDIKKIDFDVAFVGAGAYGFPLSVEIKKMGKIAMETCGNTPLFFGIYGERNLKYGCDKYMTDAWIRPQEEPPKGYKKVEDGCYW